MNTKETVFNEIGISDELDWDRIIHLMKIGLFAALMVLIGDMLLGWGMRDPSLQGLEGMLSLYVHLSDARIFWSSILGFIGIPLEGLCYFAIYRLIAPYSKKYAHLYRTGIFGYLIFAGCGVHVMCLACVFFYRTMAITDAANALALSVQFGKYFLLPGMILFLIFWIIHSYAHIAAFAKGYTPYPKWCWIFSMPVGQALTMMLKILPETAVRNAITAGWISIGNLWMFAGLLIMAKKIRNQ